MNKLQVKIFTNAIPFYSIATGRLKQWEHEKAINEWLSTNRGVEIKDIKHDITSSLFNGGVFITSLYYTDNTQDTGNQQ
jgi:hypothetical protein